MSMGKGARTHTRKRCRDCALPYSERHETPCASLANGGMHDFKSEGDPVINEPNIENVTPIGTEVMNYADAAMYRSEPMPSAGITVRIISMTQNPLLVNSAVTGIYKGRVTRDLADVSKEDALNDFAQIAKTHLKAPWETVDFVFLIEGVDRSFTHQMVRQRTATYFQESMRFAVKEGMDQEIALPPSLAGMPDDHPMVVIWRAAVNAAQDRYEALIAAGMPAEEARGLAPHAVPTRLYYKTNLRALWEHAGMRLCTQAQFHWRLVFSGIAEAIRNYKRPEFRADDPYQDANDEVWYDREGWQYEAIANIFRPVCYNTGKCEFMADFDRACSIRERVQANHRIGRPSSEWDKDYDVVEGNPIVSGVGPKSILVDDKGAPVFIGAIRPAEWLLDPFSAIS